jgi:putative phosphoribosyl transferase
MSTATTTHFRTAGTELEGDLILPRGAQGVVVFAHGSGSSRHSPRNRHVAGELHRRSLGTLLVDLLTHEEEVEEARARDLRFDIGLLADRLVGLIDWLGGHPETRSLPVGLFGASTGAAAALVAAAARPESVHAVASRGGRPDLAGATMPAGGELRIVPGATHLFEEPGALEIVAEEAGTWFATHLR